MVLRFLRFCYFCDFWFKSQKIATPQDMSETAILRYLRFRDLNHRNLRICQKLRFWYICDFLDLKSPTRRVCDFLGFKSQNHKILRICQKLCFLRYWWFLRFRSQNRKNHRICQKLRFCDISDLNPQNRRICQKLRFCDICDFCVI